MRICLPLTFFLLQTFFLSSHGFSLETYIKPSDKRYYTFKTTIDLMDRRQAKVIVETGTARKGAAGCESDGCSTLIYADWAKENDAKYYSVDINPASIEGARTDVEKINPKVKLILGDSVGFLKDFNETIDLLYLDSFDFSGHNPLPSQLHHLYEIEGVYKNLHRDSVIMFDDWDINNANGGKGGLALQYLKTRGWEILMIGYQAIIIYRGHVMPYKTATTATTMRDNTTLLKYDYSFRLMSRPLYSWHKASKGYIYESTFSVDNKYVGRCKVPATDDIAYGNIVVSSQALLYSWGGANRRFNEYECLIINPLCTPEWVSFENATSRQQFWVGSQDTYIGKMSYMGETRIGKIFKDEFFFGFDTEEISRHISEAEILIIDPKLCSL